MRADIATDLVTSENDELLTTGEAAKLLGVTKQHIIDLCERGDLPYSWVGSHRRIRRSDLPKANPNPARMTSDQRRSLWLGIAVAGKVVLDPERHVGRALHHVEHTHNPNHWDEVWRGLLNGPIERVLEALTSPTLKNRELRQNSPFVDSLTEHERERVLASARAARERA